MISPLLSPAMAEVFPNLVKEFASGLTLLGILLNVYLCGVLSQQLYTYWTSGFKDPIYVRVFIVVQFAIVIFQSAMLWTLAWNVYVLNYGQAGITPKSQTWEAPVNSACQCILIIMANGFLTVRIYTLTHNRLQSGLVFGFSFVAFIAGVTTIATSSSVSYVRGFTVSQRALSIIWHVSQLVAECLIMYFLSRALLAQRSGLQRSDNMVKRLARNVVQIGLLPTLWAIGGLAAWYSLPRVSVNCLFDMTSGSVYTHMIYDGLLVRKRLRERLDEPSVVELGFSSQSFSRPLEGKRSLGGSRPHVAVSRVTVTDLRPTTQNTSSSSGTGNEPECAPVGKSAAGYEIRWKDDVDEINVDT